MIKSRLLVLAFFIFTFVALAGAQAPAISKKRLAWELGSALSLAGVLHAQDFEKAIVDRRFAAASGAASALGIKLPGLPAKTGDKINNSAVVLHYLLGSTGGPIGKILQENLGAEHAAIFEIALKSNILLLMYGPGESTTNTIANVIRTRRTAANIPNVITDTLLKLIDRQATYAEVKAELFIVHDVAPAYLAVMEFSENGERSYQAGEYAASAAAFTQAIKLDPDGPDHYFSRGRAFLQLGKNNEAIADYTKVILLKDKSSTVKQNLPTVYHNRGLCYGLIAKNALAIADLTTAIKLRPDYASAYKVRGLVYKKMGNVKLANADFQTAERLQPGITK